jgi:hypothetical protein
MTNSPDRCNQLRKLHDHLTNEVKTLRESMQRAQQEGITTSTASLNTIKSLQNALQTISLELQKCPPEQSESGISSQEEKSSLLRQVKATLPAQRVRNWFPDAEQHDNEDDRLSEE